jgi:hypothetical protein
VVACAPAAPLSAAPTTAPSATQTTAVPRTLTVYSAREEALVGPIIEQFKQVSGIEVKVKYGTNPELVATIREEGANSPADVLFATDPFQLSVNAQDRRRADREVQIRAVALGEDREKAVNAVGADREDVHGADLDRFLRRRGYVLETRPIKGTRQRGGTLREDRARARELRASAKDRAENVMIVDLARNDLGRVASYGSVQVRRLCALERHPGLHHLVSVVEARVPAAVGPADIVRAAFPPGSVTGAPKIRALEIIEELEPVRRGVYCGSIGWIGPAGDLDLSVAIRTFTAARGRLNLYVGGAVVADSKPSLEWEETMHKAARLLEAAGGELESVRCTAIDQDHAPLSRPRQVGGRPGAGPQGEAKLLRRDGQNLPHAEERHVRPPRLPHRHEKERHTLF